MKLEIKKARQSQKQTADLNEEIKELKFDY